MKNYEDTLTLGDEATGRSPELRRVYDDGTVETMTGDRAMANADTPAGEEWRKGKSPSEIYALQFRKDDMREGLEYKLGKSVRETLDNITPSTPTWFGRQMDKGMVPGAIMGAGGGFLAMLLAGLLRKFVTNEGSPLAWGLAGALGGAGVGGYIGDERSKGLQKRAAMFQDDRNVILEKLMGATDIGAVEKAKLAAAVRNMSPSAAQELAGMVRASLSFGIGALIAKYLFGQGGSGILFGGLAGVLGGAKLMGIAQQSFGTQPFLDSHTPLRYRDIL